MDLAHAALPAALQRERPRLENDVMSLIHSTRYGRQRKLFTLLDLHVSSLHRGHANILWTVLSLT